MFTAMNLVVPPRISSFLYLKKKVQLKCWFYRKPLSYLKSLGFRSRPQKWLPWLKLCYFFAGWNSVSSSKFFHANLVTVNWIRLTNGFLPHPFQHISKVWHCCTDYDEAHIQWTELYVDLIYRVWPKSGQKCWK